MDNQEQRRIHTQQGHDDHGVHIVCHKCGWSFPNPHPSAKLRRAHKKICGTIEGYNKLLVSDDELLFDDDCKTQVPNTFDIAENEKQCGRTEERLIRSGDEVFLDAIANFSDGALSPGVKESLDSPIDVEIVDVKYPEFSRCSRDNDFQGSSVSKNAGNVRDFSLTSVAKEINLKGKDEIKSDSDVIEIVVSDNTLDGTCEGVPKFAVGDMANSDCQVSGGTINLKENNNAEFLSVTPQDDPFIEVNSTVSPKGSANGVQVESADTIQSATFSDVKIIVESDKRLVETGASMPTMKTEMNGRDMIYFCEEQIWDDDHKNFPLISLPEGSSMASSKENPSDVSFGGSTTETTSIISPHNISHHERNFKEVNDVAVYGKCRGANVENDIGISIKTNQLSNLYLEDKPSSGVYNSDEVVEMGKTEKCDIPNPRYMKRHAVKDNSHLSVDEELPVKTTEVLGKNCSSLSSLNTEPPVQCISAVEDAHDVDSDRKVFGSTSVPIQDESGNSKGTIASSTIYTSVSTGGRFDSSEGNGEAVSVSGLPSIDLQASTEAGKFNLKDPKAELDRQQCEKPDMFEPPSFMTLVEPGFEIKKAESDRLQCEKPEMSELPSFLTLVEPGFEVKKAVAFEVEKRPNQHISSQAGWFPVITNITNESQGRKRNEEEIAKITTKWCPSKQQKPLRALLDEAALNKKPKSPTLEASSVHQKNSEVQEDNGSGLTSGNSISGPALPATQAVKGKDGEESNSQARYSSTSNNRQNKKVKGRPYWKQFVCCSSANKYSGAKVEDC